MLWSQTFWIQSHILFQDLRVIWLWHLSPHWLPGLIRLIWLARWVSPSSLTAPCASLPKLRARLKRTTIPDRGGPVFGQGYTSNCAPLLEPANKLTNFIPEITFQFLNLKRCNLSFLCKNTLYFSSIKAVLSPPPFFFSIFLFSMTWISCVSNI